MATIYVGIVIVLLALAVFDLIVGVSNDAVNFLNSAIGAKAAKFRTVLIIASIGVIVGAVMSNGMMDIARHGIMLPVNFTFQEVITIFLAVMVTDVIILDTFNSLGMPTSTTVSMVFELLGGTFVIATIKKMSDATGTLDYGDLLNTDKALTVIISIFMSVAIAFIFGLIVQWISRIIFTFNYNKHLRYTVALFGGIAFTTLTYFMFFKGVVNATFISDDTKAWVGANTDMLLIATFVCSTILMEALHLLRVDIFKIIVLMGTFALAMAFAGNDLVNFIGVPLAGLSSVQDFLANGHGQYSTYTMGVLMESAHTPPVYLLTAGLIMVVAMVTSKKSQNVVKTSVDLARQDEGDEMFGSSKVARSLVRATSQAGESMDGVLPKKIKSWIDSRFDKNEMIMEDGASFDMVRAAVNLVLAGMLIVIGTNLKLPLSTTYVTFMVAMGSSLADRAWGRESAVFRITGVLSVIGGWFITAGVAFTICAIVAGIMHIGGPVFMVMFIFLGAYLLVRSNRMYKKKVEKETKDSVSRLMLRAHDPEIVWDLLQKHVGRTQAFVADFTYKQYNIIIEAFINKDIKNLRRADRHISEERDILKKYRKTELLTLHRLPADITIERNTWFHLGINSSLQYMYCLKRIVEPIKEHVDNNFQPLPQELIDEYNQIRQSINELMESASTYISTGRYDNYRSVLTDADHLKDELSIVRKKHIDRMHDYTNGMLQVSLVYLNILQESQQLLSIMRHQLRAAKKFME